MTAKPLEGLKILDFCWVVAGPLTTKYLAEYGADVIRVETTKRPEVLRRGAPFKDGISGINRSEYFGNYNVGKYGVTIDMQHPRSKELVLRIAQWADVITENFTPGTLEKWELSYEDLKTANEGIILFSSSMLGRGGSMSSQPGFGPVLASLSGMTYLTGWPDREPVNPYGAYTDFIIPRFAVPAILAAWDYKKRTGQGTHLDLSQLEASVQFSAPLVLDYTVNGAINERQGNRDPGAAPHGTYPCKGEDRWIAIACDSEEAWQGLRSLACPSGSGWAYDERFSTLEGRKTAEDELDELVGQWTQQWDSRELMDRLQAVGTPAGAVNDCRDLFDDAQLSYRGHFQFPVHPEIGPYAASRSEMDLSKTPGAIDRPAPLIGEHNEYALKGLVGLSDDEYRSFEEDGVLT